jgi:hypothetical protein
LLVSLEWKFLRTGNRRRPQGFSLCQNYFPG